MKRQVKSNLGKSYVEWVLDTAETVLSCCRRRSCLSCFCSIFLTFNKYDKRLLDTATALAAAFIFIDGDII